MKVIMQSVGSNSSKREEAQPGLVGALLRILRDRWTAKTSPARKLHVIETITLGGKKQISLVRCGAEQFLVGGGFESVTAIVKLENAPGETETAGGQCR